MAFGICLKVSLKYFLSEIGFEFSNRLHADFFELQNKLPGVSVTRKKDITSRLIKLRDVSWDVESTTEMAK